MRYYMNWQITLSMSYPRSSAIAWLTHRDVREVAVFLRQGTDALTIHWVRKNLYGGTFRAARQAVYDHAQGH